MFGAGGAKTPFGTGTFGSNTNSAFGSGQTTPFGQTSGGLFGAKTQASAFGTPSFGNTTTPAFGSVSSGGGLFGGTSTSGSLFSQPATQSAGGGLFGTSTQSSSLFQPQTQSVFGQSKPTGFGTSLGTSTASTGLFGNTFGTSSSGGTFGSTAGTSSSTGGLFGTTSVFGGAAGPATNGTTIKFNPITNSETVMKNGNSMMVQTRHQCISVMKEYEAKSLEELRLEDYSAGRKSGSTASSMFGSTAQTQSSSLFGGPSASAFGQNKTAGFGGFGQSTTGTGLFGSTTQSGGLFGTNKPTGTGSVFGATAKTTAGTGFGFGTSGGLFGQTSTTGTTGSLFGQPSTGLFGGASTGFGTTQTTSSGGLFGTSTFGQPQTGGLFGATSKPFGFGGTSTSTNTFGAGSFGTGTSTGLFGNTATSKPAFAASTNTGFGTSIGGFGASNTLGTGLFGATSSGTTGTGLFGAQNKTGFGTGLGTMTGLGTGLGGTSAFGSTGGFGGLGTNTGLAANQGVAGISGVNQSSFAAFQQQQVLQQQLKALSNSPFGDSPLFRNLKESRRTKEPEISIKGPLGGSSNAASHYKVFSKQSIKLKKKPSPFLSSSKSKLFEDIYEDQSLSDNSLTPRTSVKKLVIKNKLQHSMNDNEMTSSPLRFRAFIEEDDDSSELIRPITGMRDAATRRCGDVEENTEQSSSSSITESPALLQARKKTPLLLMTENAGDSDESSASQNVEDQQSVDSETNEEQTNPCGITLTRDDYYTTPSIEELNEKVTDDGKCNVNNFVVGREGYGEVKFLGVTNVKDLDLDKIVFFRRREAEVYPDNYEGKPEVGVELNKRSEISLHNVWPNDKTSHTPIKSPDRLKKSGFIERLEEKTSAMDALFLDYKPNTGTWVFQVQHFTRYGLSEQIFADDGKEDIMKKIETDAQKREALIEFKAQKERARLIEEKLKQQQEEMRMHEENQEEDIDTSEEEHDQSHYNEHNEMKEALTDAELFSTSVQNAKIAGVDPFRIQGMKAVLFEDDDDDFMSPREKTFLSNKSLITGSVREANLKERFASPKKQKTGKLDFSILSETTSPVPSSRRPVLKSQLMKHPSITGGEKGLLRTKMSNSSVSGLFSPMVRDIDDIRKPSITTMARDVSLVPFQRSSLAAKENWIADAGLTNGRRSRVGWAPKHRFAHTGEPLGTVSGSPRQQQQQQLRASDIAKSANIFDPVSRGGAQAGTSSDFCVKIEDVILNDDAKADSYLVDCLKNSLKFSYIDTENAPAPLIEPVDNIALLHGFADLTHKFKERLGTFSKTDIRYQHAIVWDLVKTLWGKLEYRSEENLTLYQTRILRRTAVSKWLSNTLEHDIKKKVDSEKFKDAGHLDAIYSLLIGRQISAACRIAYESREFRLALLLSQASGDIKMKHLLREQLGEWKDQKADKYMNLKRLKIYQLLSGMMVWMSSHGDINLCDNLDWKKAFALHLWYYCPATASISKALQEYTNAYKGTDSYPSYANAPNPCYIPDAPIAGDDPDTVNTSNPKDLCYHLLKLFSKKSHRLERLLCPNTHTSNALDYALCWHLQQVLESLGYTHLSEQYHCLLQTSFASQLETYEHWQWAVYVLLHIKNPIRREKAVRDVLARHCHALGDCNKLSDKELFLVESVQIPSRWIFEAKALNARYCSKPYDEAVYLLKAGLWNSAHQIIIRDLASNTIIDEDYETLRELLIQLSLPERSCTVKNWTQTGQIYLDYILLREKLFEIVEGTIVVTAYSLEDLRGDVTSLISRIGSMKAVSPKERFAQAEMGKTSSNLLKIVLEELAKKGHSTDDNDDIMIDPKYTWPMCEAAPYIAHLPLPPDYIQKELEEIVSNTGDGATDMD